MQAILPLQPQGQGAVHPDPDTWMELGIKPRAWQRDALPKALDAIQQQWRSPGSADVVRPLVQAIMGAGKSIFIAAVVAEALKRTTDTIVVTAPRTMLVKQLSRTLSGLLGPQMVGSYYGDAKQPHRPIVVACDASACRLADSLAQKGLRVGLWIADECHGSEADRMKEWAASAAPIARMGLTATPRRAKDDEALSLWTEEIYRYDAAQALRDHVVVPFDLRHWHGPEETDLDDAMFAMIQQIVAEQLGPGVVDASTIDDARSYAARLRSAGIRAKSVHSHQRYATMLHTLDELRDGELDVVVHVSILKEGVDFPWLRWLALRRQVSSKVYFAQHVGRVLRAHPGKDTAVILDPGDLFSKHKLNLEAILEVDVDEPRLVVIQGGKGGGGVGAEDDEPKFAVSMDDDTSRLRSLFVQMQTQGQVGESHPGAWREQEPSEKQLAIIKKCVRQPRTRRALQKHPQVLMFRRLYGNRNRITKGQASDLISVLFALGRMG